MSSDSMQRTYNKLDLLKLMYISREGDRREGVLLRQGKGWFQVAGMGHETLGLMPLMMESDDYLFPYYRDRAMALAKGMTNRELAIAYFAKQNSSSGGRQMPGHYSCRRRNIWSVPTPTGANLLPACGVALGMQLQGKSNLVVATIGDAASRQGEFYEAVSFATERKLPVVFVVEDNRYGISTNTDGFNPFKLGIFNEELFRNVDARHPDRLWDATSDAFDRARSGSGPTVLVCELDRLCSHTSSDDHRTYRPAEEIAEMMDRDPISLLADELIDSGELSQDQWDSIRQEIDDQVDREYIEAESEPDPDPEFVLDELFGSAPIAEPPPIEGGKNWRMVDAVNQVFREGLASDSNYVFLGEDIEDPKGGVFRLTAGLSDCFPDRVFNAPLAEATIAGVGIGLASYGMKPIFEIQFIDFSGPAWNQISQNLGSLRWRTNGDWNCPCILYAPYGAYLPGGSIWHSQANEAFFAHIPGIHVVIPSTPEDAAGLMWTAMHSSDPTIYLIPKHLFRQQILVDEEVEPVPFGSARIRQSGDDVTLVTWGNCVEYAEKAIARLEEECSVELIDLRSIIPWDKKTVLQSLEKTGRLVVLQEDGESCSAGQMIVSEVTSNPESFSNLFSAPQLVSKPDVYIGYNPISEYAALPDENQVVDAIRLVMEE
ncbi:MAG: thiamine pyrophosphate-dependent enzyme [Planctomycetota bacterium]|nr:thiamine pyrophosphate-dependent enzyme [Planctomycetota bacterium]